MESKLNIIESYALEQIENHLQGTYTLQWNNSISVLGYCNWMDRTITISKRWALAAPIGDIKDIVLHEIAHALTPFEGHNYIWKAACRRIGANPSRLYAGDISKEDVALPKYQIIDTTTGEVIQNYYRKPNAKTYRNIKSFYAIGRKEETLGKLVIRKVPLLDLL